MKDNRFDLLRWEVLAGLILIYFLLYLFIPNFNQL